MPNDNKRNLQYFEALDMRLLYEAMQKWQEEHNTRFLSLAVIRDQGLCCCIALTNPTEVIIGNGLLIGGAEVRNGRLKVDVDPR